jgi:hypothetical protein
MTRACHVHTTGFDLPEPAHDLRGAAAADDGKDKLGALA